MGVHEREALGMEHQPRLVVTPDRRSVVPGATEVLTWELDLRLSAASVQPVPDDRRTDPAWMRGVK